MDEDARNTEFQDLGDLTYRIMFDLANDGDRRMRFQNR